jgi:hypothetical protein
VGSRVSVRTKILLMNVILATVTVVVFFDAPLVSAAIGAVGAGVVLWACERLNQLRRLR